MGLQQFQRGGGTHFTGDDTRQVVFHTDDVDGGQVVVFYDDAQGALETLVFLALPVEVDADGNAVQLERGQFVVEAALPQDAAVVEGDGLMTVDLPAVLLVGSQQCKFYLGGEYDSDVYVGFVHGISVSH